MACPEDTDYTDLQKNVFTYACIKSILDLLAHLLQGAMMQ